jgi:F-type H+-transporting ATPase subunit b
MTSLPIVPVLAAGGIADINPGLTLWTGITFIVLLVVLRKFAWGPIVSMLDERERTIRDAIDQAKKERLEAERLLGEQKASLARAQREASDLAKRSQADMEALRVDLTARARKEADDLVAGARLQIQEEKAKAMGEIRAMAADLAVEGAKRLIQLNLDDGKQRQLVEEYLSQLPADRAA